MLFLLWFLLHHGQAVAHHANSHLLVCVNHWCGPRIVIG